MPNGYELPFPFLSDEGDYIEDDMDGNEGATCDVPVPSAIHIPDLYYT